MQTSTLTEIGLEEKEAKLYMALLKRGDAPASKIAEDLGLDRTTVYYLLLRMHEKGFVSYHTKNSVKVFSAINPEKINNLLIHKQKDFEKLLPELKKLSESTKEDVHVEVYKGKEGLNSIYREIINTGGELLSLGIDEKKFSEIDNLHFQQYVKEVDSGRIKEKLITVEGATIFGSNQSEYRFIPKEYFHNVPIAVFRNKVIMIIWEPVLTEIVIENKEAAESFRKHFNKLWKGLRKKRQP
ncbi:MAG: helix-turn-helix domain-containing protein [Candidatus Diapherotrites archaeon]|nr:helix-turn-helix domain-containing protein [Candidatus Diapherotrites archaeon]